MRLNFARHMPLLLIPVLLPAIIWPASATTDTTPPVWPSGSRITALSITSSSIYISWTPATDDSGTVNYKVYEDGAWNGMYTMSTSYGHQYLAPNTTIAFQITAVDPSNNWSTGPSAAFTTAPAQCQGYEACLTSLFTYTLTSTPGGTITVNDTLTNEGQDSIRITTITVAADQVVYSLTRGTQLLLRVGESGTRGLVIRVPQDETIGTHSILLSVSWDYNSTIEGWRQGNGLSESRTFSVVSPPAPNQPNLPGLASLIRGLAGYAYLFVGGYLALASLGVALVIRNDRRKRAALLRPSSSQNP